jgi:hypothetical protein
MLKKIGLSILMVIVTGVLVFGAVNRTIAKTGDESTGGAFSEGRGQADQRDELQQERAFALQNEGRGLSATESGSGGQANNPDPQTDPEEWAIYTGSVVSFDETLLVVKLDDGTQLAVEGRAWAFAQEVEFHTQVGNRLSLQGFFEDDEFKITTLTDLTSGEWVVFRENNGRPSWAGNGWGGGRQK